MRYTEEFLERYRDMRKAGFIGTVPEYIEYLNNYARDNKERMDKNITNAENPFEDDVIPF